MRDVNLRPYLEVEYSLPALAKTLYIKDHLGSTRVVVREDGSMKEAYNYYPFGFEHEIRDGFHPGSCPEGNVLSGMPGRTFLSGTVVTKNLFTGKERDAETGWDYFGARYYDPALGRWLAVDPLGEKHPEWSPFNYVLYNPLILIDPDGRQVRSDSPGLIPAFRRQYERANQLRKQKWGNEGLFANPVAKELMWRDLNTYGPTTLDASSLVFLASGQPQLAGVTGYLSAAWTFRLSLKQNNLDGVVSVTTALGQAVSKSKKGKLILSSVQFVFDLTLSGKSNENFLSSSGTGFTEPDNTKVNSDLLKSVANDFGWETINWKWVQQFYEKGKKKKKESEDESGD